MALWVTRWRPNQNSTQAISNEKRAQVTSTVLYFGPRAFAPVLVESLLMTKNSLVTLERRWNTQTDASMVMTAHRLLSSALRGSDNSDWTIHSLLLSLHDLHGFPSSV